MNSIILHIVLPIVLACHTSANYAPPDLNQMGVFPDYFNSISSSRSEKNDHLKDPIVVPASSAQPHYETSVFSSSKDDIATNENPSKIKSVIITTDTDHEIDDTWSVSSSSTSDNNNNNKNNNNDVDSMSKETKQDILNDLIGSMLALINSSTKGKLSEQLPIIGEIIYKFIGIFERLDKIQK